MLIAPRLQASLRSHYNVLLVLAGCCRAQTCKAESGWLLGWTCWL